MKSLEFIRDLLEAVPTSANAKQYAKIVSEKAKVTYQSGTLLMIMSRD